MPGAVRADSTYKILPVIKIGDPVGDLTLKAAPDLRIGTLNDAGQLVYAASIGVGPLVQFTDGKHVPIVIPGGDAPGGKWTAAPNLPHVIDMNERGNVVFGATARVGATAALGVFLWNAQARQVTAITLPGMPASAGLTFESPGGADFAIPSINNHDEIALRTRVKDAAGVAKPGVFFRDGAGRLTQVLLNGQEFPGGGKSVTSGSLDLNDAGVFAFLCGRQGIDPGQAVSSLLWEQATLTPVTTVGQEVTVGNKLTRTLAIRVNDKDRSALVVLTAGNSPTQAVLYRHAEGKLQPIAVAGQEMPGGGKLQSLITGTSVAGLTAQYYLSRANSAGQIAFLARLEDGGRAIYRVDATTGQLALLLKEGLNTEMGTVTRIQEVFGVGYNSKGQLAAVLKFGDGPNTLVLMTPTAP